jgi:DNA-binding PadR family transcriptional regulator
VPAAEPPIGLPLSETTFLILLSLSDTPRHGYAILKDVEHLSAGRIALGTGTLYGALKRLLDAGWIERVEDRDVGHDATTQAGDVPHPGGEGDPGRVRKVYALTDQGRSVLAAEVSRLRQLVNAARRLAGAPA